MTLSEARATIPVRLPWGTEWLVSWSGHSLADMQPTQGDVWLSVQDRQAMSLKLSGKADAIMAGLASSALYDVFFAGELYNRDELCGDLSLPLDCRDAEVVLSAWRTWGPGAFRRIDGVFAIIVRDFNEGQLWAARDPTGRHPLFFAQADHGLLFSDAIPVLLRHPNVSRKLNRLLLAQMNFGRYGEPHETFYSSIYKVPPAHYLCATRGRWKLEQYWFLPEVRPPEEYSFDEAREDYSREFARVVARYHERGQPSILLSGGLDSISVAAQSADISRSRGAAGPLALSLLFPHPECDERPVQEAVARALGLRQISMSFDEAVGPLGLVGGALALSPNLSSPVFNTWHPAYLPLINAAKPFGDGVVLTGIGGDEWLGVSPLYMADLIKRGRFFSAARTLGEQLRSFNLPLHSALRFQLWNSGLRPLLVRGVRPIVTRFAAPVARAVWRRRQHVPTWIAPDPELRAEILLCLERGVEQQFEQRFNRGRYAFYMTDAPASYIHPLVSSDREEDFEIGKLVGQRLEHPYWDPRLIRRLFEIPPEWLAHNGYSKGLVRGPIAKRFPGLGLERKKKVSATNFSIELMRRELPPAWKSFGGPKALSGLGVVDRCILDGEKSDIMTNGDVLQLTRTWFLLIMESWVRARL